MATQNYLTRAEKRKLERVTAEIVQIEHRIKLSHGLGDTNGAQGITSTFSDNLYWQRRLDALRRLRDALEDIRDGYESEPQSGISLSIYRGI